MAYLLVRQLRKRRKNPLLVRGNNSRTRVADFETNPFAVQADPPYSYIHATLQNKLDGVAEEVYQHLLYARRIRQYPFGNAGVYLDSHLDVLAPGRIAKRRHRVVHDLADSGRRFLYLQGAGLDPREIQKIVDQPDQLAAIALEHAYVRG